MNKLAELTCGVVYCLDSTAISAIATTAAVFVALWIPARERRARYLDKLETQARAATLISQSLSGLIAIMPNVIAKIRDNNGIMLDVPGNEIIYATDECQRIIEREAFVHQLPTAYLDIGELTISLARQWRAQIATRIEVQRSEELRKATDWKEHAFVCSLGKQLHNSANQLRKKCQATKDRYKIEKMFVIRRYITKLRIGKKHQGVLDTKE